jgi:pimeloyl-[acyl-carrier protein] methyl ester esterase
MQPVLPARSRRDAAHMVTLVLLPGMDGTGDLFDEFVAEIGTQCRSLVIRYPVDVPLGYRELYDLIRAGLPPDEPFVLLGESFSGPLAIAVASASPPGLAGLVLCCTFARNPVPVFSKLEALIGLLPISSGLLPLLHPILLGSFSSPRLRAALKAAVRKVSAKVFRRRLREVLNVDYSGKLRQINVPVLYLRAEQDRLLPASVPAQFSGMKRFEMRSVNGPHLLLQAQPEASAAIVMEFVAKTILPTPRPGID